MPIDVGMLAPVSWAAGTAGLTVSLTVTRPDGTTNTPTVTEDANGLYKADVDTAGFPGRFLLNWTAPGYAYSDILDVWPADPRFIVSAEDAMDALQWRPADRARDGEQLRLYAAAATEVIEDITGAILVRTVDQDADGGRTGVALWERPDEILTVTVDGKLWDGWVLNKNAAIVYADKRGSRFPDGRQIIHITYKTGLDTIPPSVRLATRELIRHMWQVGQQAPAPTTPAGATADAAHTPSGFAVPRRVIELCANRPHLAGIA